MALGNCKACGAMVAQDAKFCIKCGASLDDPWKCLSCGTKNPSEAAFCATCGTGLSSGTPRNISRIWAEPGDSRSASVETSCPRCGSPVLTTDWMCPTCGRDLQTTEQIVAREDSPVPTVIGVLLIIAGGPEHHQWASARVGGLHNSRIWILRRARGRGRSGDHPRRVRRHWEEALHSGVRRFYHHTVQRRPVLHLLDTRSRSRDRFVGCEERVRIVTEGRG